MVALSSRLLLGSLVIMSADPTTAATYYVRKIGRDTNDGSSPATAFASIRRAAEAARGRTGHTIYVGAGQYEEGNINTGGSGLPRDPIRFVADTDGAATGDAGTVLVDATGFANGFRISARPWVIVNGFSVTNADEAGIDIKSRSDNSMVANCVVFSNAMDGIHVRDSASVIVFNNLVYANGLDGIELSGDQNGAAKATVLNNTVYANGLDGVRIEETLQADRQTEKVTVLHNVIANNGAVGLNLKESSGQRFVGQWNLLSGNLAGDYNTVGIAKGVLDLDDAPLLVNPSGTDGKLGGTGHMDDNFQLRQQSAGQADNSRAVDASPISPKKLGLQNASTRTDQEPDTGNLDVGFHGGSKTDIISGSQRRMERRLKRIRRLARRCGKLGAKARKTVQSGVGPCLKRASRNRLIRRCGPIIADICG